MADGGARRSSPRSPLLDFLVAIRLICTLRDCARSVLVSKTRDLLKGKIWLSNIDGRKVKMIGCRHSQPSWFVNGSQ